MQKKYLLAAATAVLTTSLCVMSVVSCSRGTTDIITLDLTESLNQDVPLSSSLEKAISSAHCLDLGGVVLASPRIFHIGDGLCGIRDKGDIYFYDLNSGEQLSSFNRKGRGPQEYNSVFGVSFRDGQVCVSDYPSYKKALFYTMEGDFLGVRELPEEAIFRFFGEKEFVLSYSSNTDKRLTVLRNNEPILETSCSADVRNTPIVSYGDVLPGDIYTIQLTDTLYKVSNENVVPYLFFDKGQYAVPLEERGNINVVEGCISGEGIVIGGRFGFVDMFYQLPQREVWDLENEKLLYKVTFSEQNQDPGIPLEWNGDSFEFWPVYGTKDALYGFRQLVDKTELVIVNLK